jgi:glycosyltransferase involved in cell wall biosynthesis
MLNNKTVAVVVPAYNEEKQISIVINSMPDFVDRIVLVNDNSTDETSTVIQQYVLKESIDYFHDKIGVFEIVPNLYNEAEVVLQKLRDQEMEFFTPSEIVNKNPEKSRIIHINHLQNGGVGASIATGYKWCLDNNIDCTAVMAGDGQMDPAELRDICSPVVIEKIDYVKGNRLRHRSARYVIPKKRFFGNSVLSILTKVASGYWRVSDTQTGFTAISLTALRSIDLHKIYKRYGMPNDLLVKLNIASCTLREVEIKPVYRIGENSKMKIPKVMFSIFWILTNGFFHRLWFKYFFRDFHPLFILYNLAFILFFTSIPFSFKLLSYLMGNHVGERPILHAILFMFLIVSAFQSLLFAMWMDIQDNERLYK